MLRRCFSSVLLMRFKAPKELFEDIPDNPKYAGTQDAIIGDMFRVMERRHKAGESLDMEWVYKETNEIAFEKKYGMKPPSKKTMHKNYMPLHPEANVRRLLPLSMFDDDPWPERSFATDEERANFHKLIDRGDAEKKTASNRSTITSFRQEDNLVIDENAEKEAEKFEAAEEVKVELEAQVPLEARRDAFLEAVEEMSFWELRLVEFVRGIRLNQRRSLPLYVDQYKHLVHRVARAERHFLAKRDALTSRIVVDVEQFGETEKRVERVRKIWVETTKSLWKKNYDPSQYKKAVTGAFMRMTDEEFEEWKDEDRENKLMMIQEFTTKEMVEITPPKVTQYQEEGTAQPGSSPAE